MTDDTNQHDPRQELIDANLKKVFQRTLEEEVPDKFTDLLAKLREAEEKGSNNAKS